MVNSKGRKGNTARWEGVQRPTGLWRGPGPARGPAKKFSDGQVVFGKPPDPWKRSVGGVGGDDAADCLRYLVATKAREIMVRKLRGL